MLLQLLLWLILLLLQTLMMYFLKLNLTLIFCELNSTFYKYQKIKATNIMKISNSQLYSRFSICSIVVQQASFPNQQADTSVYPKIYVWMEAEPVLKTDYHLQNVAVVYMCNLFFQHACILKFMRVSHIGLQFCNACCKNKYYCGLKSINITVMSSVLLLDLSFFAHYKQHPSFSANLFIGGGFMWVYISWLKINF